MIGIVYSAKDLAGKNIAKHLEGRLPKDVLLHEIEEDIIFAEGLDDLGCDFVVMASRHKSASGKPTLTVHPTGNFDKAEYGGEEKTLQMTAASAMHNVYLEMLNCDLDFEVSREATHHGPTGFKTPIFFVEIGSDEKKWVDEKAGEFLADCILEGLKRKSTHEVAIAFGGGHYCPRWSTMHEFAFSHIAAKYAVEFLDRNLMEQMVAKTFDGVDVALLDEKGIKGREKNRVKELLDAVGVQY